MHSFRKSIYKSSNKKTLVPPTVTAMSDRKFSADFTTGDSLVIDALATEGSGTINRVEWAEITNALSSTYKITPSLREGNITTFDTTVSDLTGDYYEFQITVTDTNGLTASDTVVLERQIGSTLISTLLPGGTSQSDVIDHDFELTIDPNLVLSPKETVRIPYNISLSLSRDADTFTAFATASIQFFIDGTLVGSFNRSTVDMTGTGSENFTYSNFMDISAGQTATYRIYLTAESASGETTSSTLFVEFNNASFVLPLNTTKGITNLPVTEGEFVNSSTP